ncbi:MAG TPA: SRPBCC family protein [Acidobacteriaceae bacterium]
MSNAAELDLRVLKTIQVKAPIERAFSVFVEQMETWWPATHHVGKTPFVAIFVEPRVGGRWYERNAEGAFCEWGTVLAWDPPHRVRFSWHVGPGHDQPDWVFDPDMAKASEVEIRFRSEGPSTTFVELEHSKIERHGEGAVQLRDMFDGPGAWISILELFAGAAERAFTQGKE